MSLYEFALYISIYINTIAYHQTRKNLKEVYTIQSLLISIVITSCAYFFARPTDIIDFFIPTFFEVFLILSTINIFLKHDFIVKRKDDW